MFWVTRRIMMSEGCKVVNMEFINIADGEITLSAMECNARYRFRNCTKLWLGSSKEILAFLRIDAFYELVFTIKNAEFHKNMGILSLELNHKLVNPSMIEKATPINEGEVGERPHPGFFGSHFRISHRNWKILPNLESSLKSTFIWTNFNNFNFLNLFYY